MVVASRLSWHAEWTFSGGATHGSRASQRRASFLWRGGGRAPLFRSLTSYGCENRASWNGGAGWVEKCASALICGTPTRDSLRWTNDKYKESSGIAPLHSGPSRPPRVGETHLRSSQSTGCAFAAAVRDKGKLFCWSFLERMLQAAPCQTVALACKVSTTALLHHARGINKVAT